jgi:hypothetical protein
VKYSFEAITHVIKCFLSSILDKHHIFILESAQLMNREHRENCVYYYLRSAANIPPNAERQYKHGT